MTVTMLESPAPFVLALLAGLFLSCVGALPAPAFERVEPIPWGLSGPPALMAEARSRSGRQAAAHAAEDMPDFGFLDTLSRWTPVASRSGISAREGLALSAQGGGLSHVAGFQGMITLHIPF